MTHARERYSTTSLFAAWEVASAKVRANCVPARIIDAKQAASAAIAISEFIGRLDSSATRYARLELHVTCENYASRQTSG
jgi:hypothetical protein